MKKLISMMLMLCAIITFSACSSDDDNTPTSPISGVVVPSSAKIGSEVTLQGKGFANGQTLWLRNANNQGDFAQLDAKFTSNGATFTIPYSCTEGSYQVVLEANNSSFVLGTMSLQAADCPVTLPTIPSNVALKSTEISMIGVGFAQGDVIAVAPVDFESASSVELPTTLTDNGVKVDFSTINKEDDYNVYLKRGNSTWLLGQTYIYQPRQIESITISDNTMLTAYASMLGLSDGTLTLNFKYNEDGTLHAITSNGSLGWEFTYNGNTVTTSDTYGRPLTYTLDAAGSVDTSTGYDMFGEEVKYNWYNAPLIQSLWCVARDGTDYTADDAFVATMTKGNTDSYRLSLKNVFTPNTSLHACPGTVEPAYLLNAFGLLMTRDDLFLGFFLPKTMETSLYVPATIAAEEQAEDGTTKMGNPFNIESSFENNTLTMKTVGGVISQAQALYTNTVVVKYKNK